MPVIVSKATRRLVVPVHPAVTNMFPAAPKLDDGHVLVHHGMVEYLILKHLGLKVPHPMLTYYDWPGGQQPFAVQRSTCALMTSNPRAYILNDMGTGKTRSALWSWDYLNTNKYAKKLLVVAPLSTLRFVWAREVFGTLPHRKVAVLHGTRARRIELLNSDADIFIINHDGVKVIMDLLRGREDIDTLVLDELAVYRNNSDRSKGMRKLAEQFQFVWGMTGRPMPNKPTDVWSQCKVVTPYTVPKYFNQVRDMLMTKVSQYVYIPKENAVEQAFAMMQPQVRFSLDDVVELPPFVSRTIDVEMSKEQIETYHKIAKVFQAMVAEQKITAVNAGAAMNKLLQVSLGWVYTSPPEYVMIPNRPRTDALLDLVRSAPHKTIVFVPYRHALTGLSKIFTDEEIDHAVVHGDVNDRDKIFNLFQNTSKYDTLLCHPECVAHGLTLTAADTIIWASPTASLDIYEQANARIRRYGQKHKQQFLHIQATPVERKMYTLLRNKQKIQDQLLSMFELATEQGAL